MLEDVVNFAKERQETYYSRLQSTSFLAFVDLAQVLLQFATAPKTAQHIKSNSSCSIVSIIGEHGAGKTTLAKAALEFVFQYLPKVHARRIGKQADSLFPEPWTVCPTFTQVQSSNTSRSVLYHEVNNGFATTGPVVQHHMKNSTATVGFAGPEAVVLVDDAHDPSPWIYGSNPAVFIGLSDGTRCIKPLTKSTPDSTFGPSAPATSLLHQNRQDAHCDFSVTNTSHASHLTFDLEKPSQGLRLRQQTNTPTKLTSVFARGLTQTGATNADSPFCMRALKTASSMIVCLGNVPPPKKGDTAHEMKAEFVDAHRKVLIHLARFRASDDANMKADEQSQWVAGATSFWKAAAEVMVTRISPGLVRVSPAHKANLAMYKEMCQLSASEISRLMEISSNPPISALQTEQRVKDPLRNGLPPPELQNLFSAGMDALELCRGFAHASFTGPYNAWVTVLKGAIEKRKATQSSTVTEDSMQRIRPAVVLWLPTPSSSSNGLRDEISAFVDKACTSGDVSLSALDVLDSDIGEKHPYPRAVQLSPYHVRALVSDCGEKLLSADGLDAKVWDWGYNRKGMMGSLQRIFTEESSVDEGTDTRVVKFLRHLQPSSLPPQSCIQEAAAWVITSRFVAYPQTGTIVSERVSVSGSGVTSNGAEGLACILLQLRAVCTGVTSPCEEETESLWNEALAIAKGIQEETLTSRVAKAIDMFNGIICAVARAFVSIALDPEHVAPHSTMLAQVVPEDVGRVVADIMASRCGQGVGGTNPRDGDTVQRPKHIDTTVALNALSYAKGQGSVRELRSTMRTTANVYASSLYADRVAAGIEWISSFLAESIFRGSFPTDDDDVSAAARSIASCREFVATTGVDFDDIGTALKCFIQAIDSPSLHFIRESAKSKQVFAVIEQTAASCDIRAALKHAGVHHGGGDFIQGFDDHIYDTDTPSHSQAVSGARRPFTQMTDGLDPIDERRNYFSLPAACLAQRRSRSGDPAHTKNTGFAVKEGTVNGKLSRIRCHAIWGVLNIARKEGTDGYASDDAVSSSDDNSIRDGRNRDGRGELGTEGGGHWLGREPLTILVCMARDRLAKVGEGDTGGFTYLCQSCLMNKVQTAIAVWFGSRERWQSEVELLASSPAVQNIVTEALRDMHLRFGSTVTGRGGTRKDIQQYFNNLPRPVGGPSFPKLAAVVFDESSKTFTVNMARLIDSSSLPPGYEIVLPRPNIPMSNFLRPAQVYRRKSEKSRVKENSIMTLREVAVDLARKYLQDLTFPEEPLPREDFEKLGNAMVKLCSQRSSGGVTVSCLNYIIRGSPVLEKLRANDLASTNLLAAAIAVGEKAQEREELGTQNVADSSESFGDESPVEGGGLDRLCSRKKGSSPIEIIDVTEKDGLGDRALEEENQEVTGNKWTGSDTRKPVLGVTEKDGLGDRALEEENQEVTGNKWTGSDTRKPVLGLPVTRFVMPQEVGQTQHNNSRVQRLANIFTNDPDLMDEVLALVPSAGLTQSVPDTLRSPHRGFSPVGGTREYRRRRDLSEEAGYYKGGEGLKRRKL
jgi:hypothetical protein